MAQHYNICGLEVKYCQIIEGSIRRKFSFGIEKVRRSIRFIEDLNFNYKEHEDDVVFYTKRLVGRENETLEIHFDVKTKVVTKIYVVK